MTTCIYDRRTKSFAADSQNTASDGAIYKVNKIEKLPNGWYFIGSGHCYTIGQCRSWVQAGFNESAYPDWELYLTDTDEYGFTCFAISPSGDSVYLLDGEMTNQEVLDEYVAAGSGGSWAIGAMDAGATIEQAINIAAARDTNTSAPFTFYTIKD